MSKRVIFRKILALAAAYAIAVQAVLLGFAAATNARAELSGVLCVGSDARGTPGLPGQDGPQHDGPCCLAAGCCAFSDAELGSAAEPTAMARPHSAMRLSVLYRAPNIWPSERPRSSRAPPA